MSALLTQGLLVRTKVIHFSNEGTDVPTGAEGVIEKIDTVRGHPMMITVRLADGRRFIAENTTIEPVPPPRGLVDLLRF